VNNCRVVQLDHQDLKGERSAKIVPVHALSTLVSLALQGDSEESEEEEEIDEMDIIKERIDEGYSFEEAADFDSNLQHSMSEFEFPEINCAAGLSGGSNGQPAKQSNSSESSQSTIQGETLVKNDDQEGMEEREEKSEEDQKGDDHHSGESFNREEAVKKAKEQAFIGFGSKIFGSKKSTFCGVEKMNIISMNVAGGKQAKDSPSEFVSAILSLLLEHNAQIFCIQDCNLIQDSYAMRVLSSLLGKVGLTVSSSVRSTTKDESLRNSSMGVMIISPSGFTLKSSVRKDETCMLLCYSYCATAGSDSIMPEILHSFDFSEHFADNQRGKYGIIDHVFLGLQQAVGKQRPLARIYSSVL